MILSSNQSVKCKTFRSPTPFRRFRAVESPPDVATLDDLPYTEAWRHFRRLSRWFVLKLALELTGKGIAAEAPQSPCTAFWRGSDGLLHRTRLIAYSSPWHSRFAPWVVRASVNYAEGGIVPRTLHQRLGITAEGKPGWKLELSCLPTEALDLPAWLAAWIVARPAIEKYIPPAPHSIVCGRSDDYVWSPSAAKVYDAYVKEDSERKVRIRARSAARAQGVQQ